MHSLTTIDSHTGGEPTRVVLEGFPDLGSGPLRERAARLARDHRALYRSVLLEPRGQVAMVGALLTPPTDPDCVTGVLYFDAGAVLGMCGHGTIGLTVTLHHLGRIGAGRHLIETPAGIVTAELHDANTVTITNVESRLARAGVTVDVPGLGPVTGDVAYGGNWFFLVDEAPVPVARGNIAALGEATMAVRARLAALSITGDEGAAIDHVIFYGDADDPHVHSRNFVLCPDDAYDRSPCGTGSSARLASLAASGRWPAERELVQESIIGSTYRLSYTAGPTGGVIPKVTGKAHIMAQTTLIFDPHDPFRDGIVV